MDQEAPVGVRSAGTRQPTLLCVAAYLGHESLVQRLLDDGAPPFCHSHIFASPMQRAALAGRGHILRQLQERVPNPETLNAAKLYYHRWAWNGREVPSARWGAAAAGRVYILELAVKDIPSDSRDASSASNFARTIATSGTQGQTTSFTDEEAPGAKSSWVRTRDATWDALDAVWTYAQFEAPSLEMLRYLFARAGGGHTENMHGTAQHLQPLRQRRDRTLPARPRRRRV